MPKQRKAPWKRKNPRRASGRPATHLTPSQTVAAKRRAKQAGRKYPNLVDNMREAAKFRKGGRKTQRNKR